MKVFLVFLALVIVLSGALVFAEDSLRFMMLQKRLKVLAEECAEAAAMCIDEERSAADGQLHIDLKRGHAAAQEVLSRTKAFETFGKAELSVSISAYGRTGVRAEVVWRGEDLMRLSFIKKQQATRAAAYEWITGS